MGAADVGLFVIKEILRIERVVPEELEDRPEELIRARFGDDVEHAAAGAPVFRSHRVGDDAELLDGLDAGHNAVRAGRRVVERVVICRSVEREQILTGAGASARALDRAPYARGI